MTCQLHHMAVNLPVVFMWLSFSIKHTFNFLSTLTNIFVRSTGPISPFHLERPPWFCVFASFDRKPALVSTCVFSPDGERGRSNKAVFSRRGGVAVFLCVPHACFVRVWPLLSIPPGLQHQRSLFKNWYPWQHIMARAPGQTHTLGERKREKNSC